jgi:hypothetical protein
MRMEKAEKSFVCRGLDAPKWMPALQERWNRGARLPLGWNVRLLAERNGLHRVFSRAPSPRGSMAERLSGICRFEAFRRLEPRNRRPGRTLS